MKQRYSIWGREYGSDHDVEIVQVNSNPRDVVDALINKKLSVNHSACPGGKKTKVRKYTYLRIVDNGERG